MTDDPSPRDLRIATRVRGVAIGMLILAYGFVSKQSSGSFTSSLLIAAALQIAVLVARKWVPPDRMPMTQYSLEMIADGVTVLLFALGVFGSIARMQPQL